MTVHRTSVLGGILGAAVGFKNLPQDLVKNLKHADEVSKEIDAFVDICMGVLKSDRC